MTKIYVNPIVAKANRLAKLLRKANSPTIGENAAQLWEICSSNHSIGIITARKLYVKAGYIPFRGFPLERAP